MPERKSHLATAMAEALEPVSKEIKRRNALVRPVSQFIVQLDNVDRRAFAKAQEVCLRWLANRAGQALPDNAWDGRSFDLEELGAQRVGAVSIDEPKYWSARIDDADKKVPQRTWVTELAIGQRPDGSVLFGARLVCSTRGPDEPFERSVPGFVRGVVEACTARLDGLLISEEPWVVSTDEDVEDLVALLTRPDRESEVIAISLPEGSEDPLDAVVSARNLTHRVLGVAHVAVVTSDASYKLTDAIGKEFSVFRGAVRTYMPGLDIDFDEPRSHPMGLAERIRDWAGEGPENYESLLVSSALKRAASRRDREQRLPTFAAVRQIARREEMKKARAGAASDKELLDFALNQVSELEQAIEEQKKEYEEIVLSAEEESRKAIEQAEQAKSRVIAFQRQIIALEERVAEKEGAEQAEVPHSLEGFEDWCERNLTARVELHNRAYQGVKKSEFLDIRLIYNALMLLRDKYVTMRRNSELVSRANFEQAALDLGLEEGRSISKERVGEEGDAYFVNYGGKKRLLDRHLKNGNNSKDRRYCFRLYFFWDEELEQVVVGWMPSHLDTRQT